ncbi:hypothetical protein CRYUN_Cryun13aG0061900 [Craigia yunnanensis]
MQVDLVATMDQYVTCIVDESQKFFLGAVYGCNEEMIEEDFGAIYPPHIPLSLMTLGCLLGITISLLIPMNALNTMALK